MQRSVNAKTFRISKYINFPPSNMQRFLCPISIVGNLFLGPFFKSHDAKCCLYPSSYLLIYFFSLLYYFVFCLLLFLSKEKQNFCLFFLIILFCFVYTIFLFLCLNKISIFLSLFFLRTKSPVSFSIKDQ